MWAQFAIWISFVDFIILKISLGPMLIGATVDNNFGFAYKFVVVGLVDHPNNLRYPLLLKFQSSLTVVPLDFHLFDLVLTLSLPGLVALEQNAVFDLQRFVFELEMLDLAVEPHFFSHEFLMLCGDSLEVLFMIKIL